MSKCAEADGNVNMKVSVPFSEMTDRRTLPFSLTDEASLQNKHEATFNLMRTGSLCPQNVRLTSDI